MSLSDGVSQTAVLEQRAVRARNFPAAWVQPAAISALPQKAQVLLQRIGEIGQTPVVVTGPHGPEVIANFKTATAAREAARRLHGTDLRTDAEKKAVDYQPAKEHERFWLQLVEPGSVTAAAAASVVRGAKIAKPKKCTVGNGLILSPLPPTWAEKDVMVLVQPYGQTLSVRMDTLESGKRSAHIEFTKDTFAKNAKQQLDGLSLLGDPIQCVFQERAEAPKPAQMHIIFIDELAMPSRPAVEPRLDDCELFVTDLPPPCRDVESARIWLSGFQGSVKEVLVLRDENQVSTGKAYARFSTHKEARQTLKGIEDLSFGSAKKAFWSESERVMQRHNSPYGLDVLKAMSGSDNSILAEIAEKAGAAGIRLEIPTTNIPDAQTGRAGRVHFAVTCEEQEQLDECKQLLVVELAKVHEAYVKDVRGTLVVRGFPASWSEQSLKTIFTSYGGIVSNVMLKGEQVGSDGGLAYVRLRSAAAMDKAASNLNQTKVGDGDMVEECVLQCSRRRLRAWSDGDFEVSFFLDQLQLNQRPLTTPGPDDRELFVKNLPLQDMNRQQIQEYFEGFGEVEDLHLIQDPFTHDDTSEGYVRFRFHADAVRCIDALSPVQGGTDADSAELSGQWSESERALQRKLNSYHFSLVVELVGPDGSKLQALRDEAKVKSLWLMAESLTQRDREAPVASGKQLQFVARCSSQEQVSLLRECLERSMSAIHSKIKKRDARKRRKSEEAASGVSRQRSSAMLAPEEVKSGMKASAPPMPWPSPHGQAPPPGWMPPQHPPAAWGPPGYYWPPPHGGKGGDDGRYDPMRVGHVPGPPPCSTPGMPPMPPPGIPGPVPGHPPGGVSMNGRPGVDDRRERSRGRRRAPHEDGGDMHRDGNHRHHRKRRREGEE
mmetsp:Transcript_3515/g.8752  ORF Transcript_3515/g.8752 Transcript_3515/m.8752 type:complete len:886 (-) Transcript_3515:50-2707(-)